MEPQTEEINRIIFNRFNINLRQFQLHSLSLILQHRDVFIAVPTGAGKTICYCTIPTVADAMKQPAKPSMVVVVSPLLALMDNQVLELSKLGIRATHLGSTQQDPTMLAQVLDGAGRKLRDKLVAVVIDEAHCIDKWGEDFRPAFKKLGQLRAIIPDIPYMVLTATATQAIHNSITTTLCSRPNCPWLPLSPIAMFHKSTAHSNKSHVLSEFPKSSSVVRLVICTVAFGLGINVPDIRHVINLGCPSSIEEFVQESGRAGRDGMDSISTLYHITSLLRRGTEASMLKYCSHDIPCRRSYIAQHFKLNDYEEYAAPEVKPAPRCCDLCDAA
ncbi:uncharacterized protein [Amphiura filiformis]|uniref:uncharacterized protein n=1 Tax=Amphiura filiformis TaxID=82378 RepID=UPI003B21C36B